MKLTQQRFEVLKLIKEKVKEKATAKTIGLLYQESSGKAPGNIYEVLNDLADQGFIAKIGTDYQITEAGIDFFSDKTPDEKVPITFTEEESKKFEDFAKKVDVIDVLPRMLNPALMGLERERLACLLSMVSQNDIFGDNYRLSILYEGPPGTGKTAIIRWAPDHLWGFFIDSDSSKAALKGTASGYQCKPGLLVDADGSVVFIDEIDKMDPENQAALLGAMSSGKIVINMDKVKNQEFEAKVRCIATCNNRSALKAELIDRFDIKIGIKPLDKEAKQRFIRRKLNNWGREKEIMEEDAGFLKRYLEYARTLPVNLPENREKIANYFIQELESGKLQGKDPRRIESGIRLCLAFARLRLHREITDDDLKKAMEMIS